MLTVHGLDYVDQDPVAECKEKCQRELDQLRREQEEKVQDATRKKNVVMKKILEAHMKKHEEDMQKLLETKEREFKEEQKVLKEEQDKEIEEEMELMIQENKLQEAKLKSNHKKEERAAKKAAEKQQEDSAAAATTSPSPALPECPVNTKEGRN